jgi:hypothetical protein
MLLRGKFVEYAKHWLEENFVRTGVDGLPVVQSHNEMIAMQIGIYFDSVAERHSVTPVFIKGKYSGIDCEVATKIKGIYQFGCEHPISDSMSVYFGSSDSNIRNRFNEHSRIIVTGKTTGKQSDAIARQWVPKHGNALEYAYCSYFPLDLPQSRLRDIESILTKHMKNVYGSDVLNIATKPMLTKVKKDKTPALSGLDI